MYFFQCNSYPLIWYPLSQFLFVRKALPEFGHKRHTHKLLELAAFKASNCPTYVQHHQFRPVYFDKSRDICVKNTLGDAQMKSGKGKLKLSLTNPWHILAVTRLSMSTFISKSVQCIGHSLRLHDSHLTGISRTDVQEHQPAI